MLIERSLRGAAVCALTLLAPSVTGLQITGATSGIDASSGARPLRTEINDFAKSGAHFDLYILALQQVQNRSQTDQDSFFGVGGIHGLPYVEWDGSSGTHQAGYCTHASILFPTWHRPYVALYEQLVWQAATTIAAAWGGVDSAKYIAAAKDLRVPYWDWASNATLPDVFTTPTIFINTQVGRRTVTNPLYAYTFHPRPASPQFPSSSVSTRYASSVRYPDSSGKSNEGSVTSAMTSHADDIHDRTYLLLTQQTDYTAFSNTAASDSNGQPTDSIENIHNGIHNYIGGPNGHMTYPTDAGFDPIFFLHHAQVDRLIAIWQALNPNSFVTSEADAAGTFTNAPGGNEDADSALTPFHSDSGSTFFTSNTARALKTFGYAYPEVQDWGVSASQLSDNTRAKIKALYDPDGSLSKRGLPLVKELLQGSGPDAGTYNAWYIKLRVNQFELGQPFWLHFFDGKPESKDSSGWLTDKNLISTFAPFIPQDASGHADKVVYSQIPLTRKLANDYGAGLVKSLSPDEIVPFLQDKLTWKIQTLDGKEVSPDKLTSLKIHVSHQPVTPAGTNDKSFPKYGKFTDHDDATKGKQGGVSSSTPSPY